jgi:DNA-binding XRE family transcriptional regulator
MDIRIVLDFLKQRYGDPQKFLNNVAGQLALHGLSKYRLAQEIEMRKDNLYNLFNGMYAPSLETMLRIDYGLQRLISGRDESE